MKNRVYSRLFLNNLPRRGPGIGQIRVMAGWRKCDLNRALVSLGLVLLSFH